MGEEIRFVKFTIVFDNLVLKYLLCLIKICFWVRLSTKNSYSVETFLSKVKMELKENKNISPFCYQLFHF